MERHEILEAMTELKLYGMRASFDVNGGAKPCQVGGVIVGHDFA